MNIEDYFNSNDCHLKLLRQLMCIQIEDRTLRADNIFYCPSRATSAKVLEISAEGEITIRLYAQDFPIWRFATNLLRFETSNPYLEKGQLY